MLSDDIDPTSRCRLPLPRREDFDEQGQRLFDASANLSGGSIRGLRGPGGIQLHSPGLVQHARPLNRFLRLEASFTPRVRELVILITARECNSQFEWAAHETEAIHQGVASEVVDVIKHRNSTQGLDDADAALIELGRELFATKKVSSLTYARAFEHFGTRMLVELVALMGNYAGTALLLAVFDMQLDPGVDPPLA
jgi:4-carboxymuconolactone decarboxylase